MLFLSKSLANCRCNWCLACLSFSVWILFVMFVWDGVLRGVGSRWRDAWEGHHRGYDLNSKQSVSRAKNWAVMLITEYLWAKRIINTQDNLQKEVDHLARVLKQNNYPANFIHNTHTGNSRHKQPKQGTGGGEGTTGGGTLCGWDKWGHQACLQGIQDQNSLEVRADSPLNVDQGEGYIKKQ